MRETYEWGARITPHIDEIGNFVSNLSITTVARYSGYRRFDVTTEEEYIGPPEEHP